MAWRQRCIVCWLLLAVLGQGVDMRAQATNPNDPNAGSDVTGKIMAPGGAMEFVGIPAADREAMKANVERLWAIVLRNPALNPPKGYDLKPSFSANGILPGPREPFIGKAAGFLYWYRYMPGYGRVQRLDVAMHAFYVTANFPSLVFADRWQQDGDGVMYYEPREIRRVGGYPQYRNGVIAVTDSRRALWIPAARQRVLRRELAGARERLQDLRQIADLDASLPAALQARRRAERQAAEQCVSYLEGELARLSPAELAAPAYVSLSARRPVPKPGCSNMVDKTFPDAVGIVAANPGFFDASLPRTALQAIFLDFSNFETPSFSHETWRLKAYESLRDGMDYKALAATLATR